MPAAQLTATRLEALINRIIALHDGNRSQQPRLLQLEDAVVYGGTWAISSTGLYLECAATPAALLIPHEVIDGEEVTGFAAVVYAETTMYPICQLVEMQDTSGVIAGTTTPASVDDEWSIVTCTIAPYAVTGKGLAFDFTAGDVGDRIAGVVLTLGHP
jgi:hypothetical protein